MSNPISDCRPFESLRSSLSFLSEKGELIRIKRKVSPKFELAAIVQNVQQTVNKAICFENVEGFDGTVVSNICGSHKNIAFALSADPRSLASAWAAKCEKVGVFDYPVYSKSTFNLIKRSLKELPEIVFHDKDAGPYITGGIFLAKNPETGTINLSFHRVQLTGTDELGIRLTPSGHLFLNQTICEQQGKPLECAILIGNSPLMLLAASTIVSRSESELDLASHLLGRPWPLRKCRTMDLEIPEDTEIVIEGEILPHLRRTEGPFGEWMGYYTVPEPNHVFKVKGVFARENPHYYTVVVANEDILLNGIPTAGLILKAIKVFVPFVLDVVCWPTPQFCIIKMKKQYDGEEHKALLAALGAELKKILYAIVVDEDVDIYNPSDVIWALSTRCRPDKDIFIIPDVPSYLRDPSRRHWGRVGIDATVPLELAKEFERKSNSMLGRVRWEDYL